MRFAPNIAIYEAFPSHLTLPSALRGKGDNSPKLFRCGTQGSEVGNSIEATQMEAGHINPGHKYQTCVLP